MSFASEVTTPTRSTTDPELGVLRALRRILRAVELHSRELAQGCGLTGPQLTLLRAALETPAPTPGQLARDVHLAPATVSGILDRLEARDLVRRRRDAADRRRVVVEVSEAGRAVAAAAPSLLQDRLRRRLAGLAEWEQLLLLSALQRVAALMDADGLDAAPLLDSAPELAAPARDAGAGVAP